MRKTSSAIAGFVAMMTNRARLRHSKPFGADALFGEDIHPFFRTVQADQGHACPTLLVRCCSRKAGDWCFPRQENVRQKKKRKQEKEEGKTFRSERTVNFGPKSQQFLNQKVFVLSSAPFLSMLRRRRAPSWALPCV